MTGHATEGSLSDLCMTHINKTSVLLDFLKHEKKGLILNVGSGAGLQSKKLNEQGFDVISTDVSMDLLRLNSGKVVLADASNLPFKENKFDFVACMDVLEHLEDDDSCVDGMHYSIKSSGKLLLSVPMLDYPFVYDPINKIRTWVGMKPLPIGLWAWEHKRLYNEEQIISKIKLRFDIVEKRKLSSFIVALFENYLPYLLSYKIKLKSSGKPPVFLKKVANTICKVDDKIFLDQLGYINLALKAKPV